MNLKDKGRSTKGCFSEGEDGRGRGYGGSWGIDFFSKKVFCERIGERYGKT